MFDIFDVAECKCLQVVHSLVAKITNYVDNKMTEICTGHSENRKKGQIIQHVKVGKSG